MLTTQKSFSSQYHTSVTLDPIRSQNTGAYFYVHRPKIFLVTISRTVRKKCPRIARTFFANGKRLRPSPDSSSSTLFHVKFFLNFPKGNSFCSAKPKNRSVLPNEGGAFLYSSLKNFLSQYHTSVTLDPIRSQNTGAYFYVHRPKIFLVTISRTVRKNVLA